MERFTVLVKRTIRISVYSGLAAVVTLGGYLGVSGKDKDYSIDYDLATNFTNYANADTFTSDSTTGDDADDGDGDGDG